MAAGLARLRQCDPAEEPMKRFTVLAVAAAAIAMMPAMPSAAEESRSAAPAATLTASLDRLKLEAIAARDPEDPGRYIAALYIPGSQLLVVSAPYAAPAVLDKKIAEGKYMDAYVDMQSVADHKGHFFVVDMNADGLMRICAARTGLRQHHGRERHPDCVRWQLEGTEAEPGRLRRRVQDQRRAVREDAGSADRRPGAQDHHALSRNRPSSRRVRRRFEAIGACLRGGVMRRACA